MSLLTRFAKAFTAEDRGADEPSGLIEDQTGRVYYIKPDGTRVEVSGGGGAQPLTVLGPITVDWDTPGVNTTDVVLAALDPGTTVVRVWFIGTEAWDDGGGTTSEFTMDITNADGSVFYELFRVSNYGPGVAAVLEGTDVAPPTPPVTMIGRVPANVSGWKLRAYIFSNTGPYLSGSADFYALVHVPT